MSFTTCNLCSEHSPMASKGTQSRMIDLNCDSKWSFANQARLLLSKMLCINFIQCITLPLGTFRLPNAECLCENDFRCKNNCSSQTTSFVVWNSTLLHWIQSSLCMMIWGKSKSFNVLCSCEDGLVYVNICQTDVRVMLCMYSGRCTYSARSFCASSERL